MTPEIVNAFAAACGAVTAVATLLLAWQQVVERNEERRRRRRDLPSKPADVRGRDSDAA